MTACRSPSVMVEGARMRRQIGGRQRISPTLSWYTWLIDGPAPESRNSPTARVTRSASR